MSDLITQLKELKLYGMADCYAELRHQGVSGATASMESSEWLLQSLLKAESTDRAIRSIGYQMHAARFPVHRDLAGFDFSQSRVDETLIRHFATLAFTQTAQNVVLIGGTGTGKTHLMWRARPKNHYGPQRSVSRAFSTRANGYASSPRWNWSTPWSGRNPPANRASWRSA